MSYIFNSMPFELYVFGLIAVIIVSPYAMYETHKLKPGHPIIWIIPFADLAAVGMILYRCALELTDNQLFQNITDVISIITGVLFVISFIVTVIIANKKGYTSKTENQGALKTAIAAFIVAIIGIILLVIISIHKNM